MNKFGKWDKGAPNVEAEVEALKDLYSKEVITRSEYQRELIKLQQKRLMYIISTNGGYTPSKKLMKQYNKERPSIGEAKKMQDIDRAIKTRDEFVKQLTEAYEEKEGSKEEPSE